MSIITPTPPEPLLLTPTMPTPPSPSEAAPALGTEPRSLDAARGLLADIQRRVAGTPGRRDGVHLADGNRDGPPDLDELWREFNRKLGSLFGRGARRGNGAGDPGGGPSFQPNLRNAGVGAALILGIVVMIWFGSGAFIVQEGQMAVITSFGRYSHTVGAGFQLRLPYPFQAHETVNVAQRRSVDVGRNVVSQATGLRDSSMLTQDENIVDIRFTVQYRVKDDGAPNFLFRNKDPEGAVVLAAESAVRETVGKSRIDSVLYEQRDAIASQLLISIQQQLDRLETGILILSVNMQSVSAPEQVQVAFDDTLKAGQDGDRAKKEGVAYASSEIPKAQGTASRLSEEAQGYSARVEAQARGDAARFTSQLAEYQKAPQVTRDRLYIDTMREVYSNVSKIVVDTHGSTSLLGLPLDKLLQQAAAGAPAASTAAPSSSAALPVPETTQPSGTVDVRSRDGQRSRERDVR